MSRLTRTKSDDILISMAASPFGVALLAALRALVLRVALSTAGIDHELTEANVTTMFNLQGSSTRYNSQYGNFGSLQSRLPWTQFKKLVTALFEALTTARRSQLGYIPSQMLLASTPTTPLDAGGQAAIDALTTTIEPAMQSHLAGGAPGSSSSSSSSTSRHTSPPSLPQVPSPRASLPSPLPGAFTIDSRHSLAANLIHLVASRARRSLSAAEAATLVTAFDEGLSVFQAGGAADRQQMLASKVLVALTTQSGTWLWAATNEAVEHPTSSIPLLAASIVDLCGNTAAMLFADAAADFTTGR
jgi:hypothetical protein